LTDGTGQEDARLHDRLSLQHRASAEGGGSSCLLGIKEAKNFASVLSSSLGL